MSYFEKEKELQQMVAEGKMVEAFDKFYAENVVMVEPMSGTNEGKEANRKREMEWMSSLKEAHGGGATNISSNEAEGITMTESWFDGTFQDGNRVKMEEVSVKKWEGDQIVHERFYYSMG